MKPSKNDENKKKEEHDEYDDYDGAYGAGVASIYMGGYGGGCMRRRLLRGDDWGPIGR